MHVYLDNLLGYLTRVLEEAISPDIRLAADEKSLTILIETPEKSIRLYEPDLILNASQFFIGISIHELSSFICTTTGTKILTYKNEIGHSQNKNCKYKNYLFTLLVVLSRVTEYKAKDKDQHSRALISNNAPYAFNCHQIPWAEVIIDKIAESLTLCCVNAHYYELTCDLDRPYKYKSPSQVLKLIGKMTLQRQFLNAFKNIFLALVSTVRKRFDPFQEGLVKLMEFGEIFDRKRIFIMTASPGIHDYGYSITTDNFLLTSVTSLRDAGWEFGHHPSYNTMDNYSLHEHELNVYQELFKQEPLCSRQHYLRYDLENFKVRLKNLFVKCDYSFGYYDNVGFIMGTTRPVPLFSFGIEEHDKSKEVIEHPLLIMDSGLEAVCKGLSQHEIDRMLEKFHKSCARYKIPFTVLWHNSSFDGKWSKLSVNLDTVQNGK